MAQARGRIERGSPKPRSDAKPSKAGVALLVLVALVGTFAQTRWGSSGRGVTSIHKDGLDDAFISYRYARHFVEGQGLTFNRGERVEGFTNPAWVAISALVYLMVGETRLHSAVVVLSAIVVALTIVALWRAGRRLDTGLVLGAIAGLAWTPYVWAWTTSGLETPVVVSLQLFLWFGVALLERDRETARAGAVGRERRRALEDPLLLVVFTAWALCLLRSDGFVYAGIALGYLIVRKLPGAFKAASAVAAVVALLFVSRFSYYGRWLPNTYDAKVSASPVDRVVTGVGQLANLAWEVGLALPLVVVAVACVLRAKGRLTRDLDFALVFTGLTLAYWLWVGGDHFGERFLVVFFPVGLGLLTSFCMAQWGWRRGAVTSMVLYLGLLLALALWRDNRFSYTGDRYDALRELGVFLGSEHPDARLAVGAAGKVPFYSNLRAIDMRGLTDRHIASVSDAAFENPGHDKSDVEYVLNRSPELIVAFVRNSRLDMVLGLDAARYRQAGYRMRYLVNIGRETAVPNIIDLEEDGDLDADVEALFSRGYRYGVLERVGRE